MEPREFLELQWGESPPGLVNLWTLPDKRSRWYREFTKVNDDLGALTHMDVYAAAVTAEPGATANAATRVTSRTANALAGLWVDINLDHPDPEDNQPNPASVSQALEALGRGLPEPTLTVDAGSSVQCWWLFTQPWMLEGPLERQQAERMLNWWHKRALAALGAHGRETARMPFLGSIVRMPGTRNNRIPGESIPVEVVRQSDVRLDQKQTLALLPEPAVKPGAWRRAEIYRDEIRGEELTEAEFTEAELPFTETRLTETRLTETRAPEAGSEGRW